jgi:hypothetical protein
MPKIEKKQNTAQGSRHTVQGVDFFPRSVVFSILGTLGILAHFRHSLHLGSPTTSCLTTDLVIGMPFINKTYTMQEEVKNHVQSH